MIPDLLNLLTPEERAAWALCEGATPGPWVDMTSAGHDVGAFDGEIRAALSFTHICSDVPGDDRENDRAFIAGSRDALPAALTTIATLRAEHVAYRANADDLFQEMRVRGEALQRDLRDAESAASVEASEADRLRAELRAVADLIQEVGVLGIASTMDAVVVSGQPSARDLLTWAAKAMDTWPEERQVLRAEVATLRETLAEQQRAFVIGLDLAQRTADAEIAELRARLTTGIGLPLGVNDRDGNPVHVGDTLAFLGSVWNRGVEDPPDHVFVVRFDRGQVHFDGTVSDIGDYCRIVKRWNEKAADDAVKGAT